jgi:hypothetical protein
VWPVDANLMAVRISKMMGVRLTVMRRRCKVAEEGTQYARVHSVPVVQA